MTAVKSEVNRYRHQAHYIAEMLATLGRLQRLVHSQRPKGVKRRVLPVFPIARQSGSHRLPRSLHRKRHQQVLQPEAASDPERSLNFTNFRRPVLPLLRTFPLHEGCDCFVGEPTSPPRPMTARAPLLWEMPGATMGADPQAQPAPEHELDQRIAW